MTKSEPNITVAVDLTNPGQFFACCGLLELADRLWPGAEGWFADDRFLLTGPSECSLSVLLDELSAISVSNTMTLRQNARIKDLTAMTKKQRAKTPGLEDEIKILASLRRELPITLTGTFTVFIDWFRDDVAGGSRFKTWAGQQSALDIASAMHRGMAGAMKASESSLWHNARSIGLPFNFDSDLGRQGSALDIGFSFDALAGSASTRIDGTCKPALEFLCFVGLQRFRPRKLPKSNRYVYTAWETPQFASVAAAVVCGAVYMNDAPKYEFKLLYRTKYLKSFLPSVSFQGDRDE